MLFKNYQERNPDFAHLKSTINTLQDISHHTPIVCLFLKELPANAQVVYASPYDGIQLEGLSLFLRNCKLFLIENYSHCSEGDVKEIKNALHQRIQDIQDVVDIELIEDDFEKVWPTLKNVDLLLLDGPVTTCNFDPFRNTFVYTMHDIYLHFRDEAEIISPYIQYIARDDEMLLVDPNFCALDKHLQEHIINFQMILEPTETWRRFGPYGWLKGRKQK